MKKALILITALLVSLIIVSCPTPGDEIADGNFTLMLELDWFGIDTANITKVRFERIPEEMLGRFLDEPVEIAVPEGVKKIKIGVFPVEADRDIVYKATAIDKDGKTLKVKKGTISPPMKGEKEIVLRPYRVYINNSFIHKAEGTSYLVTSYGGDPYSKEPDKGGGEMEAYQRGFAYVPGEASTEIPGFGDFLEYWKQVEVEVMNRKETGSVNIMPPSIHIISILPGVYDYYLNETNVKREQVNVKLYLEKPAMPEHGKVAGFEFSDTKFNKKPIVFSAADEKVLIGEIKAFPGTHDYSLTACMSISEREGSDPSLERYISDTFSGTYEVPSEGGDVVIASPSPLYHSILRVTPEPDWEHDRISLHYEEVGNKENDGDGAIVFLWCQTSEEFVLEPGRYKLSASGSRDYSTVTFDRKEEFKTVESGKLYEWKPDLRRSYVGNTAYGDVTVRIVWDDTWDTSFNKFTVGFQHRENESIATQRTFQFSSSWTSGKEIVLENLPGGNYDFSITAMKKNDDAFSKDAPAVVSPGDTIEVDLINLEVKVFSKTP